ncbi:MAG: phosphoserine phosphatase SerB [Thaumarchaeota archaeon]|nr:phosphoserine phosphatase SerB [Nitrososphaerota archaeon]
MLAIFDIEGVLIDGEFMPEIAKLVGREKEVEELTQKGIRGEINWEQGLFMRVDALKGISYDECIKLARRMSLMRGAVETFRELKRMGFKTMAVSGGPTVLSDRIKGELGIDYVFANELLFTNGRLSGINLRVTSNKAYVLTDTIKWLGEEKKNIFAAVDGANDLKLFEISGLKIAFCAATIVQKHADHIIKERDLRKILPYVKKYLAKFEQTQLAKTARQ